MCSHYTKTSNFFLKKVVNGVTKIVYTFDHKRTIYVTLEFKQSKWLKPYISLNTNYGTNLKNQFEKDMFKLMDCSIIGKTIQNNTKGIDPCNLHQHKANADVNAKANC